MRLAADRCQDRGRASYPAFAEKVSTAPRPLIPGKQTATARIGYDIARRALSGKSTAQASVATIIERIATSHGTRLDPGSRLKWEERFGARLGDVTIHHDSVAAEAAEGAVARAFTIGQQIFFADGAYAPDTAAGESLLAHELAHAVQNQGSAPPSSAPTVTMPGDFIEREADSMADAALAGAAPVVPSAPTHHGAPMIARRGIGDVNEEDNELALGMSHRGSSVGMFVALTTEQLQTFLANEGLADRLASDIEATFTVNEVPMLESAAFLGSIAVSNRVKRDLNTWLGGDGLPTVAAFLAEREQTLSALQLLEGLELHLEALGVDVGTIDWSATAFELIDDPPFEATTLLDSSLLDRYHLFLRAIGSEAMVRPAVFSPIAPPARLADLIFDYATSLETEAFGDAPSVHSEAFLEDWIDRIVGLKYVPDGFSADDLVASSRADVDAERARILETFMGGYAPDIVVQFFLDDWALAGQSTDGYLDGIDLEAKRGALLDHLVEEFIKLARADEGWRNALFFQAHEEARIGLIKMIGWAAEGMEAGHVDLYDRIAITPLDELDLETFNIGKDPAGYFESASAIATATHAVLAAVDGGTPIDEALASVSVPQDSEFRFVVGLADLMTHLISLKSLIEQHEAEARETIRAELDVSFDDVAEIVRSVYDRAAAFIEEQYIPKLHEIALRRVTENRDQIKDWLDNWDTKTPRLVAHYRIAAWGLGDVADKLESGEAIEAELNGQTIDVSEVDKLRAAASALEALADRLESDDGADEKKAELQEALDGFEHVKGNIEDEDYEPDKYGPEVHREAREALGIGEYPEFATYGMVFAGMVAPSANPFLARAVVNWRFVEATEIELSTIALFVAAGLLTVASILVPGAAGLVLTIIDIGVGVGMAAHGVEEANDVLDLALLDPDLEIQGVSVEQARSAVRHAWVGLAISILIPVGIAGFVGMIIYRSSRGATSLNNLLHLQRALDADPVAVERLLKITDDAVALDRILGQVPDIARLEKLFEHVPELAKLEELLSVFPDAVRLETILDSGGNVAQLTRIADRVPDAAKLDELLLLYGDDAALLDSHLSTLGSDSGTAARLEALLGRAGGVAELDNMFMFCDDMAQLEALATFVPDIGQLGTLLERTASGARVVDLFDHVGDLNQVTLFLDHLGDADDVRRFMPLIEAKPAEAVEMARLLASSPGEAARFARLFGESAIAKVTAGDGATIRLGGELPIAPAKLSTLADEELELLVRMADDPAAATTAQFKSFEKDHRIFFPSRVSQQVDPWVDGVLAELGLSRTSPQARLFENMSEADKQAMYVITGDGSRIRDPELRNQAVRWALGRSPSDVREFVAYAEYYGAEVKKLQREIVEGIRTGIAARPAGESVEAATRRLTALDVSAGGVGRAFPSLEGKGFKKHVSQLATTRMGESATVGGVATTRGAARADAAFATSVTELGGATGRVGLGAVDDAGLPAAVQAKANDLHFSRDAEAAYHAHVHEPEGPPTPAGMSATEHYIEGAREVIRTGTPTVQTTQSGTRTVAFLRGGDRVIVHIDGAGNAVIATYMPKRP